ncbi:unnamed protein product, partial [Mesorhabditis spiculigera]
MQSRPRDGLELADAILDAGKDLNTHVVIHGAEGRGFNAGVDIKEMQATEGFDALVAANRGCAAAFAAVYDSRCTRRRGRQRILSTAAHSGAATHLSRLVPQHMMRTLYYTAQSVDAHTLKQFGSVYDVVPREKLDECAREIAAKIAAKDTRIIRCAKEAINGIDPVDVKGSYRLEQGYTFELNLLGVSDEHRDEFVATGKPRENATQKEG